MFPPDWRVKVRTQTMLLSSDESEQMSLSEKDVLQVALFLDLLAFNQH
jgi:hypothetical protein